MGEFWDEQSRRYWQLFVLWNLRLGWKQGDIVRHIKLRGKRRLKRTDDGTAFINVQSVFTPHKAADAVLNICAASLIHEILRVNILRKKLKIRCVSGRSKSHGVLSCTIYFTPLNLLLFLETGYIKCNKKVSLFFYNFYRIAVGKSSSARVQFTFCIFFLMIA